MPHILSSTDVLTNAVQLASSIDLFTIDNLNVEIDDGSLDGIALFLQALIQVLF